MKIVTRKSMLLYVVLTVFCAEIMAQGSIQRQNGHFVAVLDFLPGSSEFQQMRNRITNPPSWQHFPDEFTENGITVKGMVRAAKLSMDWWTLYGEPVENYNFQWITTGQYQIYVDGGSTTTVTRSMLSKYPDLVRRFDALKPLDIRFRIYWKLGSDDYRSVDNMFSGGNRQNSVTTEITTGFLIGTSRSSPLSVPGIRPGNGEQFISRMYDGFQHYDIRSEAKRSWVNQFNRAGTIRIDGFSVTGIRWPVSEMKAIADLYLQYERGDVDPSPSASIAAELRRYNNLSPYDRNDYWNDTFEDIRMDVEIFNVDWNIGIRTNGRVTFQRSRNEISSLEQVPGSRNYFIMKYRERDPGKYFDKTVIIDHTGRPVPVNSKTEFADIIIDGNRIKVYEELNVFTRVKYGLIRGASYFDSRGQLISGYKNNGYLFREFSQDRRALERGIDLVVQPYRQSGGQANVRFSSLFSASDQRWWGIGEFTEYTLDGNLNILGSRKVYNTHYILGE